MTEKQFQLLLEAQTYVSDLFLNKINKSIRFHTLQHTQEVVAACEKMAIHYQLNDDDRFVLAMAAWFHDTGYSGGQAQDHENLSIQIVKDFLATHNIGHEITEKIIDCINATRMPQNPAHLIEQIICDADLFHLGTADYKEKKRLLLEELNGFGGMSISKKEWRKMNIDFLEKHKYFTSYANQNLQPLKEVYLTELKSKMNGAEKDNKKKDQAEKTKHKNKGKNKGLLEEELKQAEEKKKKKEKESQSERAISTVFRIVAQSQNNLSQMADSKANILISVNSIILTIGIGTIFRDLLTDTNLQAPVFILTVVCLLAIVFSILATRPNITSGTFTKEDIAAKKTNLLFFGNFHRMGLPDYDWAMFELLADKNYLYSSMIKDTYFLGIVLAKKYKYLRLAYNIFMYGLILSMIAFVVAFLAPDATEIYTQG